METKLIEIASAQGIWALLAIILIFYILKAQEKRDLKQEQREEKYQSIIAELTVCVKTIEDVKQNVLLIKQSLGDK